MIRSRALAMVAVALASGLCSSTQAAMEGPPATEPHVRFDGHRVIRTVLSSRRQIQTLLEISPDVWSERLGLGIEVDFRIPPDRMDELDDSGIAYQIMIDDVQLLIDREQGNNQRGGTWFTSYKTYDDIMAYLDTLAAVEPTLVSTFVVGQSLEGRDIRGLRFGGDGLNRPAFLIQGCQHAREWVSPAVCMYLADRLIRSYGSDPDIRDLVDQVEFIIIPMVNPDGYEYTWNVDRLWRKNRRDNGNGTRGVDLNRNWGYQWGGAGSSGDGSSQTYRGTAPFSEPESAAMRDFMQANPHIGFHIDMHSYSQLILQPWGYTDQILPPDHATFEMLGRDMQQAIFDVHGRTYIHGPAGQVLYLAAGIAPDWSYGALGIPGVTFELRDTGQNGFILPPDQIIPNGEEMFPATTYIGEWLARVADVSFPDGRPSFLAPNTVTPMRVQISPANGANLDSAGFKLYSREASGGPFGVSLLNFLGGDMYEALLPATACSQTLEYYIEVATTDGRTVTVPSRGATSPFTALSINTRVVLSDNFETDTGWTVANTSVTAGAWARGVPVGGGDRGDPAADFDGSGQCYCTDPADGDTDVDGGPTRLISPLLDLSAAPESIISYARWFFNDDGDEDRLDVEVSSDNGVNWVLVESVTDSGSGGWFENSFRVADLVTPTSSVRVRFSATDNPNNSVTEAAIDAFRVLEQTCGSTDLVDFDIAFGVLLDGELSELTSSDDAVVHARSLFGFNAAQPNLLILNVGAETTATSPTTLDLTIESRLSQGGGQVIVSVKNWVTNAFEQVHQYPLGTTEMVERIENLSAADRIRPSDGRIEISIKHFALIVLSTQGFDGFVDQVVVDVN